MYSCIHVLQCINLPAHFYSSRDSPEVKEVFNKYDEMMSYITRYMYVLLIVFFSLVSLNYVTIALLYVSPFLLTLYLAISLINYYHCLNTFSFEADVFIEWASGIEVIAKTNLEKPLLIWENKDGKEILKVNFDPEVSLHVQYM